jgi:tellurite resistance protein TehA-like permease
MPLMTFQIGSELYKYSLSLRIVIYILRTYPLAVKKIKPAWTIYFNGHISISLATVAITGTSQYSLDCT